MSKSSRASKSARKTRNRVTTHPGEVLGEEARALLRGFRGALSALSPQQRAEIAATADSENIGTPTPTESDRKP